MSSSAQNNVLSQFVNCPTLTFRVLLLFLMRFVCLPESMYFLPFMRSFVSCLTLLFHVPTHSSQCQVCVCVSYPLLFDVVLCFSLNCVLSSFFYSMVSSFIVDLAWWILPWWLTQSIPCSIPSGSFCACTVSDPKISCTQPEDSVSLSSESLLAFFVLLLLFLSPVQCRSSVHRGHLPLQKRIAITLQTKADLEQCKDIKSLPGWCSIA